MFFMVSGFLRRTLKVGFACGTVATTAVLLQKNGWEVSSLGVFRFSRAGFAALYLACDYKISLWNLDPNAKDYEAIKSSIHTRSAERLRNVCLENGGVFIKVGQHIGSLDYLLPKEYVSTMALLYDKVPITPVDKMFAVFKKEFNQEPKDVFSYIDPNPIGSASLSQVYKAQLKDGTDVAVKIQYPQVKARSYVDIKTMTFLVKAIKYIFPGFKYTWLAQETERNLPLELDFLQEGKNCEKVSKMLQHFSFLKIPKIYWKYSSDKILTMEFCQGTAIDDQDFMKNNKISVNEVSQKLGEVFSEMIFTHGYVHCDPHPGNLLVNKMKNGTTQITLLDHGLYQTLSDEFRLNYSHLWMSLINADVAAIRQAASNLNCGELYGLFSCIVTARSWDAILHGIKKKPTSQSEMEQIQDNATRYIVEISDVLNRIPREMLLVLKTNDVLRGIESKLQISKGAESFLAMSRYCVRTIAEAEEFFCDSIMCKLKVRLRLSWYLLKIRLIGFYLRFFNF
ncbi:aarF domain-containing protein kinase 1 isoform X1 [Octopus sinensis]|uniref:AarF domain-containing protein kinase 1 isoform X1 n=2 Tax=Octopus sinensis TaxID=2607531 RepID=A0A7E6FT11_9MOLL|nr:aarF domain-containing protein kinase 1 isoform X1 [Octopus sinensis]